MPRHDHNLAPGSIAVVLGTRPEIIKLAGIVELLGDAATVVHTGQHYDENLSAVFFHEFGMRTPDHHIAIGGATRASQIALAVTGLETLFDEIRPACVVVQGDTNTVAAGAITANAMGIPVAHVEAGLRSFDRAMPEEHNRVIADHLADLCLAPTATAAGHLAGEGVDPERIAVTGNTIVEAVERLMPPAPGRAATLDRFGVASASYALATFHRPENVDDPDHLEVILEELAALPIDVLLPLHPRSVARVEAFGLQRLLAHLHVTAPIGYRDFLSLGAESAFLVSDSGGVQEEVSVYKRPVIVVRNSTERPEVLGTFARLVQPGPDIGTVAADLLDDVSLTHRRLADLPSPYGDASAPALSVRAIEEMVGA